MRKNGSVVKKCADSLVFLGGDLSVKRMRKSGSIDVKVHTLCAPRLLAFLGRQFGPRA
jgi:hypothetical protein